MQLVTLFLVCLRVHPFSEVQPKNQIPKKLSNPHSVDHNLSPFRSPIIKGQRADLILAATRLM
jgi:hypothetical protein